MNVENKKTYLFLGLGYLGFLLVGLGLAKYVSLIQNTTGLLFTLFGYLILISIFQFAENKVGVSSKAKFMFRIGFIVLLVISLFILL